MKKLLVLALFAVTACSRGTGIGGPVPPRPISVPVPATAPDSFIVSMMTSKGEVLITAHRDWSPLAVDRFYELVKGSVWNDARFFRVVPGFVVQWGLTGDSAKDNLWRSRRVPDEPVKVPNTRGRVSFARGGPESRTLQVFINVADNSRMLDNTVQAGIAGYPPFAEVTKGMDVVDRLEGKYQDRPTALQREISENGWAWLDLQFPGLDRILTTRVTKEWR